MIPARRTQNWLPSIFNDFFGNEWMQKTNVNAPAINIIESEKDFKVEVATPGMTKDDFNIRIDNDNELVVSMEKRQENKEEDKKGRFLRREFSYSQFKQTMLLPDNIDKENISAKVNDGILSIIIPKKEQKEEKINGKVIEVQ